MEGEYSVIRIPDTYFSDYEDNTPIIVVQDGFTAGDFPGTLLLDSDSYLFYSPDQDLESDIESFILSVTIQDSVGVQMTFDFTISFVDSTELDEESTTESDDSESVDTDLPPPPPDPDCKENDDREEC